MRGYDRDEYEDLDEYEEEYEVEGEGEGEEEEEEEEEVIRQPTQEELEYLELRERLKESIRKQMKKESGSANTNSRDKKIKMPNVKYGSFFGPSQPVIAPRVILESKSLLENPRLVAQVSTSNNGGTKRLTSTNSSTHSAPKPRSNDNPPKISNGVKSKTKVQMLKNTRDYSFLLSDDAELPAPPKDLPPRNVSHPRTEGQSSKLPPKSKQVTGNNGRVVNGSHERKPGSTSNQMQPKAPSQKFAPSHKPNLGPVDSRKQPGKPNLAPVDSRKQPGRPTLAPLDSRKQPGRPNLAPPDSRKQPGKPNLAPADSRKHIGSSNGGGNGRPLGQKGLPPKNIIGSQEKKANVSKPQSSVSKQHLGQRKESQESIKGKMIAKQPISSSKPQMKPPLSKNSGRVPLQESRLKKRPARPYSDDDDDDGKAISMIRKMFKYNPNKYHDVDDDSDMEANFEDIQKEEKQSALIARKEDEEELRKIEEEERREMLRKKRKLNR